MKIIGVWHSSRLGEVPNNHVKLVVDEVKNFLKENPDAEKQSCVSIESPLITFNASHPDYELLSSGGAYRFFKALSLRLNRLGVMPKIVDSPYARRMQLAAMALEPSHDNSITFSKQQVVWSLENAKNKFGDSFDRLDIRLPITLFLKIAKKHGQLGSAARGFSEVISAIDFYRTKLMLEKAKEFNSKILVIGATHLEHVRQLEPGHALLQITHLRNENEKLAQLHGLFFEKNMQLIVDLERAFKPVYQKLELAGTLKPEPPSEFIGAGQFYLNSLRLKKHLAIKKIVENHP